MPLSNYVKPDGSVTLHHFTSNDLGPSFEVSPKHFAKNRHSRAEAKASSFPRTFFYVDTADKEHLFEGSNHYSTEHPAHKIYDVHEDKDGIIANMGVFSPGAMLHQVKEAGYDGVFYEGSFPTVSLVNPVTVSKVKKPDEEAAVKLARHKDLQKHADLWHMLNAVADEHGNADHDALHDFIATLPKHVRAGWTRAANEAGYTRPAKATAEKLAAPKRGLIGRALDHGPKHLGTPAEKRLATQRINKRTQEASDENLPFAEEVGTTVEADTNLPIAEEVGEKSLADQAHQFATQNAATLHRSNPGKFRDENHAYTHLHGFFMRNNGPKKLARKKTTPLLSDHDAILSTAKHQHDHDREYAGMLSLADKMEEEGNHTGAALLKMSYAVKMGGETPYPSLHYSAHLNDHDSLHGTRTPDGKTTIRVSAGGPDTQTGDYEAHLRPIFSITHWPHDENNPKTDYFTHHIQIKNRNHLIEVMRALPPETRDMVRRHFLALNREHPMQLEWKPRKLSRRPRSADDKPLKLARMPDRKDGTASAMASAGSVNHDKRLEVVRQILDESGLKPSSVRAALAHDGKQSRPSFAAVVRRAAHLDHLKYTAAWLGLMSGQKRLAIAHPDEDGDDFLHVISSPHSPDQLGARLRAGGVEKFTSERSDAGGTRAYVLNERGKYPVEKIAASIPNAKHSVARVRVYRVGAGPSSAADTGGTTGSTASADSRADYRSVIDAFERAAGGDKSETT